MKRAIKKALLTKTARQADAFEAFAKTHQWYKFRSIHYNRRIGYWICLVGYVSYHRRPDQIKKVRHEKAV